MMTHDALITALALTFDEEMHCVFSEVGLGSKFQRGSIPIPDLLVINKSYTQTNLRIFEVKSNRADLQRDLRDQKWEWYLPHCDRFFFALGNDFEWKDLIPESLSAGVMTYSEKTKKWRTVRQAPKNPHRKPLTEEIALSLLFHMSGRKGSQNRLTRIQAELERVKGKELGDIYHTINAQIDRRISDLKKGENIYKHTLEIAKRTAWAEIKKELGVRNWCSDNAEDVLHAAVFDPMVEAYHSGVKKLKEGLEAHDLGNSRLLKPKVL